MFGEPERPRRRLAPRHLIGALVVGSALLAAPAAAPAALPQTSGLVDLLDQANFRVDGAAMNDQSGWSVSGAGDVNGDGYGDMIVGAPYADNNLRADSGSAYVVFGRQAQGSAGAGSLDGDGFRIDGAVAMDHAGWSVSGAGDVNGDGRPDLLVASPGATFAGNGSGSVYVVFGKASTTTVDLANLGEGGFRIDAAAATSSLGKDSVAGVGDMNGDGLADVIVGSPTANTSRGSADVVYGKASSSTVSLATLGTGGFHMEGAAGTMGQTGDEVAGVGDVNGDGRRDVIVGAHDLGLNSRTGSGSTYVVFNQPPGTSVDLGALGSAGFRIDGAAANDASGDAVGEAGDLNRDGLSDVIVGAHFADNNGRTNSGSAYVVYGKHSSDAVDLLDLGAGGFRIDGAAAQDRASGDQGPGSAVAGDVDLNGDGYHDVVVGADMADPQGRTNAGAAYVVYGKAHNTNVDLASLGAGGFEIDGAAAGDQAGYSVRSRTDFNGDGRPDVFVGANTAAPNGANSGASYVVYGFGTAIAYHPSSLDATVGVPIAPLAPSFERTGSASFSVSPALPDGLALDSATGVISGTPTRLQGRSDYTVTLTDEAGAASATVSIAVLPKPGACANPQSGGPLADLLAGTAGGDRILGGGGKDTIRGLAGDDCLYGQAGNDKLFGDDGNDLLSGGSGKDRMSGGSGDDRLSGGSGKDRLSGGAGSDTLKGGKGADRIKGGPGKNKIDGGSGNDTIDSRNGVKEKVRCGKGRDTVRADRKDKLRGCERRRR